MRRAQYAVLDLLLALIGLLAAWGTAWLADHYLHPNLWWQIGAGAVAYVTTLASAGLALNWDPADTVENATGALAAVVHYALHIAGQIALLAFAVGVALIQMFTPATAAKTL